MQPVEHPHDKLQAAMWAEEQRRLALLQGDWPQLRTLLSDDLVYVHSTTARDNKASLMAKLESRALQYQALSFDEIQARWLGQCVVITGRMSAVVLKEGLSREVRSLFMTVWTPWPDAQGQTQWQLAAHQGTPLPS